MNATSVANTQPLNLVTLHDVAKAAGVAYPTACAAMGTGKVSQKTRNKVRNAASALGYDRLAVKQNNCRRAAGARMTKLSPANSVFASRDAETAAMFQLRSSGHSDAEIALRCGVCVQTVVKRIGHQPAAITSANKKLAGKVRSAKLKIKKAYVQQQAVAQYNELAAQLNTQLETAHKMATQLSSMRKSAVLASKATGTPLLRLLHPTKVN